MNGLQSGYLSDLREIKSYHLQVELEDAADVYTVQKEIKDLETVLVAVRFIDTHALIEYRDDQYYPVLLRGIENTAYTTDLGFLEHLNILDLLERLDEQEILISEYMSRVFRAPIDSELSVTLMGVGKVVKHVPLTFNNSVTARFSSDFPEINTQMIFINETTLRKVLPNQQPSIGIKTTETDLSSLQEEIADITGVKKVITWKEANSGLYSALMLEKYGMMLLLSLIFLVVIMNAKASFEKYVFHKKDEIALLRSLGSSKGEIYSIFLLQGFAIAIVGILVGTILGFLCTNNINEILVFIEKAASFILQKNTMFFIQELPVALYWHELFVLAALVLCIFLLSIFLAIHELIRKPPLEIMRYE